VSSTPPVTRYISTIFLVVYFISTIFVGCLLHINPPPHSSIDTVCSQSSHRLVTFPSNWAYAKAVCITIHESALENSAAQTAGNRHQGKRNSRQAAQKPKSYNINLLKCVCVRVCICLSMCPPIISSIGFGTADAIFSFWKKKHNIVFGALIGIGIISAFDYCASLRWVQEHYCSGDKNAE
jgi:hypothetical protein